jgi:signal transduction histidine kinase
MIATLKSSIGKMNDLLARLSPERASRLQKVQPQPVRDIIAGVVAARRGQHEVRLMGDTREWAAVDAPALEQALSHLLQNAIEASPDHEPVTVRVVRSGNEVAIAVCDSGEGMDAEFVRSRLFQPFASTKETGFGIGAFEAQTLVTAMGGRISVESQPGKGSQFTIHLAAADEPPAQQRKIA